MRFVTFRCDGTPRPGLLTEDGRIVDLAAAIPLAASQGHLSFDEPHPTDLAACIAAGQAFLTAAEVLAARAGRGDLESVCVAAETCTLLAPIPPADVTQAECNFAAGVFNGIGTTCGFPECFQFGPDGWVVDAPITWVGTTCGRGDDCDLNDSEEERWEVTIPWDQTWTFTVCDQADYDSWMFLGTSGCTSFVENNDCPSGVESEIVVALTAGTYFLTLEADSSLQCGEFQLDILADCPLDGFVERAGIAVEHPY